VPYQSEEKVKLCVTVRQRWASLSVMGGMPFMVVAKNLGHYDTQMVGQHAERKGPGAP
jgi:hypothetical protein